MPNDVQIESIPPLNTFSQLVQKQNTLLTDKKKLEENKPLITKEYEETKTAF